MAHVIRHIDVAFFKTSYVWAALPGLGESAADQVFWELRASASLAPLQGVTTGHAAFEEHLEVREALPARLLITLQPEVCL